MARVPVYQRQQSIPGTTGQQYASMSLAGENNMAQLTGAVSEVASALQAAGKRIQSREDGVARRKDFRSFAQAAQDEFDRIEAEGVPDASGNVRGMDSKDAVLAYKKSLADLRSKALEAHTGSEDSRARLQERIEEQITSLEAGFIAKHNSANRAIMDEEWNTEIGTISAAVARGDMTLAEGNAAVVKLAREDGDFAKSYDNLTMISKIEAAQGTMIVGSLNRMIAMEEYDHVERQLKQQSVIDSLPRQEYQKLVTDLAVHKKARADLAAERSLAREERMRELGVTDITRATPAQQSYITTGKWASGLQPTAVQQNLAYLNSLDPNSQIYKDARKVMGLDPVYNPKTDQDHRDRVIFEQHKRGQNVMAGKDAEYVKARLADDPDYLNRMDQRVNYIPAREGLENVSNQIHENYTIAVKALFALTDTEPLTDNPQDIQNAINEAKIKAQNGEFAFRVGGVYGDVTAFADPESKAATFRGLLPKLQLTALMDTLQKLKAETGAVGQTTEFESKLYMGSDGTLDPDNVAPTADTLVKLINELPKTLEKQRANFQSNMSLVLPEQGYTPPPPPPESYLRGRARMIEGQDGVTFVPLDQFLPNKTPTAQPATIQQQPQQPQQETPQPVAAVAPVEQNSATATPGEMKTAMDLVGGIEQVVSTDDIIQLPDGQVVEMSAIRDQMVASGLFADDPEMQEAYKLLSMSGDSLMNDYVITLPSGREISTAEIRDRFLTGGVI